MKSDFALTLLKIFGLRIVTIGNSTKCSFASFPDDSSIISMTRSVKEFFVAMSSCYATYVVIFETFISVVPKVFENDYGTIRFCVF